MERRPGRLALAWRQLSDPVVLRKRAVVTLPLLAAAVGLGSILGGRSGDTLTILGWVLLVPTALALGYGEAFFIGHGRGVRRAIFLAIFSAIASLSLCVALSTGLGGHFEARSRLIQAIVTLVLFLVTGMLVASLAALSFGLGTGYLARKIAERSAEDWP